MFTHDKVLDMPSQFQIDKNNKHYKLGYLRFLATDRAKCEVYYYLLLSVFSSLDL